MGENITTSNSVTSNLRFWAVVNLLFILRFFFPGALCRTGLLTFVLIVRWFSSSVICDGQLCWCLWSLRACRTSVHSGPSGFQSLH